METPEERKARLEAIKKVKTDETKKRLMNVSIQKKKVIDEDFREDKYDQFVQD